MFIKDIECTKDTLSWGMLMRLYMGREEGLSLEILCVLEG